MITIQRIFLISMASLLSLHSAYAATESEQFGATRIDFEIDGNHAFYIEPTGKTVDGSRPWIWYAPTFIGRNPDSALEWMFTQFLDAGFTICGIEVGESYGSPTGTRVYEKLYAYVTDELGLDSKACLLPQSRGGLMHLNWARLHPDKVQCIAGIYTVCNIASYPGVARAADAYGLTADALKSELTKHNPIDRVKPLSSAGVPMLFIHGDSDTVVPIEENAGLFVSRVQEAGGLARLITVKGKGHEVCPEFFHVQEFVDFLLGGGNALRHEGQWRHYGNDAAGTRFSPLDEIDTQNVVNLERAWTYRTGDIARSGAHYAECTPLMVDGSLYIITPFSRLVVIDATTGALQWEFSPDPPLNHKETGAGGLASRGVTYSEFGGRKRVYLPVRDGRIYCIDVDTHLPDPEFGDNGSINLRAGLPNDGRFLFLSSPPAIFEHVLLQPYGINDTSNVRNPYVPVRAYHAVTGELLWTFDTVPRPGQVGHETWGNDSWKNRGGCNPWSAISVGKDRGIFYLPIGAPNNDKYGGDRPGDNLFGNSIVALEAKTGKRLWHFQTVHHDLWDYDLPAMPNLFDMERDGKTIPAVAVLGKTGFVYTFNRVTGEPLFPIEERAVPASDFHDEQAAPTQPFPSAPPAFARQGIKAEDLNRADAESFEAAKARLSEMRSEGLFTPPSEQGTVVAPGQLGGSNWSGASVSPDGHMYIASNELPYVVRIQEGGGDFGVSVQAKHFLDDGGRPVVSPPWGTLTRLNLVEGTLDWQVPLGDFGDGDSPTGQMNFGGATATAGGLVFIGASLDGKFRAFDANTGGVLYEAQLEVPAYGAPIVYRGDDGRQYVTIYAGGGGKGKSEPGDYVIAFRLGEKE